MAPVSTRPYRGVFPVAPTIFDDRGDLDLDGQRRCIDFMIDAGSHAIDIPIMIQDAPVAGTPLSVALLARMATEIPRISYFKIEVPMAASKLRDLIAAGGDSIEGPWDGEEAITLMADLEAGATGAMTGGGYPDGIRQIVDPYFAGRREEAAAAYARWLPPINHEKRPSGLQGCKILMQAGDGIR